MNCGSLCCVDTVWSAFTVCAVVYCMCCGKAAERRWLIMGFSVDILGQEDCIEILHPPDPHTDSPTPAGASRHEKSGPWSLDNC